jgi:transposase
MAAPNKMMKQKLVEQRDQLHREMEALKNKISGIDFAIGLIDAELKPEVQPVTFRDSGRVNVKGTILEMLKECGFTGMNAITAVDMAQRRGITLDRASVSSLLSRLKKEGTLVYDGERYKLPEFARELPGLKIAHG